MNGQPGEPGEGHAQQGPPQPFTPPHGTVQPENGQPTSSSSTPQGPNATNAAAATAAATPTVPTVAAAAQAAAATAAANGPPPISPQQLPYPLN